jgi:hypothetical protein
VQADNSENPRCRFGQATDRQVGPDRTSLSVVVLDEHRTTPGILPRVDITPPIPHHHRCLQVDAETRSAVKEEPRPGFSACAVIDVVMGAHQYRIKAKDGLEQGVLLIHDRRGDEASGYVGLVCDANESEPRGPERPARVDDSREDLELLC